MRCLILFVKLELILSGSAQSDEIKSDCRQAHCGNPSGKPGQILVKSCTDKDVCTLGKNNEAKWETCPMAASQDTLKAFEADMKADKADVDSKLNKMEVSLKDLFKQHLEIIRLLHDIIGTTTLPISTTVTSAGPVWRKVYSLNTAGGLFANLDETKKKNIDDSEADLFSILYDLETMRNKDGVFHFKLCYPELTQYEFPCNEWKQSSNPVTESTITGFAGVNMTFKTAFAGLGLSPPSSSSNLIDNTPDSSQWVFSIGSLQYWPSSGQVPGPHPAVSAVKKVELSVLDTPRG